MEGKRLLADQQSKTVLFGCSNFKVENSLNRTCTRVKFILQNFPDWKIRSSYMHNQWKKIFQEMRETKIEQISIAQFISPTIIQEISHIKFANLIVLDLRKNYIRNIESITKINMPKLQNLQLNNNEITSVRPLAKADMKSLRYLSLYGNKLVEYQNFNLINFEVLSSISFDSKISYHTIVIEDLLWAVKMKCELKSSRTQLFKIFSEKYNIQSKTLEMIKSRYRISE